MIPTGNKISSPLLQFSADQEKLTDALSVALSMGKYLWLASDELTSVERLSSQDGLTFSEHESFPLEKLIHLPALDQENADQEIDLEGIAYEDNYLWLVGSHSIKRKNVKIEDTGTIEKKIAKLAKTESVGNRYILARVPLIHNPQTGAPELVPQAVDPEDASQMLTAAQLAGDSNGNELTEAIKNEPLDKSHFAKFMSIPGKDNGFDIEGLAVAGDKIFLGLRGPVLRGWAVILEIEFKKFDGSDLKLKNIGEGARPYKKHFLDLGGLGVRELCRDGSDLLVLAGPTMNPDGPVFVYRWRDGINQPAESLTGKDKLEPLFQVPHGDRTDHAEGMTLFQTDTGRPAVLIVYDSPSQLRKDGDHAVHADVFELP